MEKISAWLDGGSSDPEASVRLEKAADGDSYVELTVAYNGQEMAVLLDSRGLHRLMVEAGYHLHDM